MNPTDIAKVVSAVAQEVQAASAPQAPGWRTSEFWLHILSLIPMGLGIALGASNPVTIGVGAAAALGASIYTACRSQVKATGLAVASGAAQAAAKAINDAVMADKAAAGK